MDIAELRELAAWIAEHGEPLRDVEIVVPIMPHLLCGDAKRRARLLARYRTVSRAKRRRGRR